MLTALGFAAVGLWMLGVLGPAPTMTRLPPPVVQLAGWGIAGFFGVAFLLLVAQRIQPRWFDRPLSSRDEVERH